MSFEQITSEALRLSPEQRAHLAESLWESLGDPFEAHGELKDDAALSLAQERDRQLEAGKVQPISHQEMMGRLRRNDR
jgi:putative addiction module component (TIGR02574 family)